MYRRFLSWLVVVSLMLGLVGPAMAQPARNVQAQDVHIQSVSLESDPTIYSVTSTSGSSPNYYVTFNHTTGSGTDRLLLLGVAWNSATNNSYITSVTFTPDGGSATDLTQAISQVNSWAYRFSAVYYLADPPGATTGAIRINFANSIANGVVAGAANFAGVDTTTPVGPGKGADLVSASTSVTLDWLVGDELVFDNVFVGGSSTGGTPGDGQTQLTGWNVLQSQARGLASTRPAPAGSTAMTWTPAGSQTSYIWTAVAVPILPTCSGTRYTLTVATDGNGSVTLNPPGGSYCSGRTVTLTPVPNSGYYFSYWSGTDAGDVETSAGVYTILMDGAKSIAANFTGTPTCQDVSLNASADTFLSAAATTTNYGNAVTLEVDGTSGTARRSALLRWNLGSIPSNAVVTSASIVLNVTDTSTVAYPLYDVAKPWVEGDGSSGSGATWATYDGSTAWGTAGASTTTGNIDRGTLNLWTSTGSFGSAGLSTVPLTAAGLNVVKRWVAGGSNNGVMVQQYSGTTNTLYFDAREGTTAPALSINYCLGTLPSFTVTFDANGGTGTMSPQTAGAPTALTLNAFTRTGYTFNGWNTEAGGGGTAYADGATYNFDVDATLYAQWTPVAGYTVTFDANGGTGTMSPQTAGVPTALTLNAFTRTGYTFNGWDTQAGGGGTAYADGATYNFDADVTLYAQWAAECYLLTLGHTGNGSNPVGEAINSISCPEGQFAAGELINLSGALPDPGWGIASWYGTDNNGSTASTNTLTMPASAFSAGVNYLRLLGDVNLDGAVDSTDSLIILSADVGISTVQFCPMNYGDVNGDGFVDSTDALIILSYDALMPVPFPVGQPATEPAITQPPGCITG